MDRTGDPIVGKSLRRADRLTLWLYQPEIADAMGDPELERVMLQKPARVGEGGN
jgi:hypothetical protein